MGYSIYIVPRCEKDAKKICYFLRQTIKEEWLDAARLASNLHGPGLSYASDETLQVGFDYSSWIGNVERAFIYDVISWAARVLGLDSYVYDGIETYHLKDELMLDFKFTHITNRITRVFCRPNKKIIREYKGYLNKIKEKWNVHARNSTNA